jgi:hypothetical protein
LVLFDESKVEELNGINVFTVGCAMLSEPKGESACEMLLLLLYIAASSPNRANPEQIR